MALRLKEDMHLASNLNVSNNININNFLRVYEVLGVKQIKIGNYGYIDRNLSIYQDSIYEGDIFTLTNENFTNLSNSLHVLGNLNSYDYSTFKKITTTNNILLNTHNNYGGSQGEDINIDSNINISNKLIHNYNYIKVDPITNITTIDKTNTSHTENLVINKETLLYDCKVFNVNCNNYSTQNLNVLNNLTCNTFDYIINIRNTLDVLDNANIYGNTNIKNSVIINGLLELNDNSMFILPRKSTNIYEANNRIINNGSLRYNDLRKTIEYYNSGWKSITSLDSISYNSSIIIHENNNSNTSNNISFIQNNNLTVEFNNITQNLNIFKPYTFFSKNVNLEGHIPHFPENILINKYAFANKDIFINKLLILGNNTSTNKTEQHLRFNNTDNFFQIYNKQWSKLKFFSTESGIDMKDNNDIEIFKNPNKIICNSNTIDFHKNLNINSNLNNSNFINIERNSNVLNNIIFYNKAILTYDKNNSLFKAFVMPNLNSHILNNYKFFNINDYSPDCNITYTTHILYILANYNNYKYVLNEFNINNNFINNNSTQYFYISTENTNCLIKSLEIHYFITSSNINNLDNIDLIDIKNKYYILIHSNNKLIYDSSTNITEFILKKNSFYTIQIKLKTNYPTENINHSDMLLFIRLKGQYYVDLYSTNNQVDFLYNSNHRFRNNIYFTNNLNIKQKFHSYKSILSNSTNLQNIYINNPDYNIIPNSSISIYDNNKNPLFIIQNNNIGIGTTEKTLNSNIFIKNKNNTDSLYIIGNSNIHKNLNVTNDIIIKNNSITTNNLIYKNLNIDTLICNNPIILNQNINCDSIYSKNIILNNNILLSSIHTKNLYFNNKSYLLNELIESNININNKKINFKNTLYFDNNCNLSINSHTCYNAFSIGDKIKPNLSIAHNGYTEINCPNNGFILDNINIFEKLNSKKTF